MEPEGSLPCSQKPAIGPYPEPNPVLPIDFYLPKLHLNVIISSTPRSSQWSLTFGPPIRQLLDCENVNVGKCQKSHKEKTEEELAYQTKEDAMD
jgi:hypothetical protein